MHAPWCCFPLANFEASMITLRALRLADLEMVYQWENNPELWSVSEQKGPFSRAEIEAFVEKCVDESNPEITRWLICIGEHAIGAVDLFDMDNKLNQCGIGIFIIDQRNRNHGYATMALKSALTRLSRSGIENVIAIIFDDNQASRRLFLRAGFSPGRSLIYNGKHATRFSLSLPL
jgi:diamine N-acetyltransferase